MDERYIKVAGKDGLYRDEATGAIVNDDSSAYHAYLTAKKKRKQEREEIEGMKKDISEIKNLLAHIEDKL